MVREIRDSELQVLLALYLHLHEDSIPEDTAQLRSVWDQILADPNHHIVVREADGRIVSSCVCVVIPNLTRGIHPYALIENVVTHPDYRGLGYASDCLSFAVELARQAGCYKVMLLTGAKDIRTLNFYRNAGFNSTDKTAFITWL